MNELNSVIGTDNYKADWLGNIYYKANNELKKLHQFKSGKVYKVRINKKSYTAARVVYEAFYGPIPVGYCVVHKNVDRADNSIKNLKLVTVGNTGKIRHRRNPVAKINESGEVLELYSSITQAAKDNYMSYNAVLRRCKKTIDNPFLRSEYDFKYT